MNIELRWRHLRKPGAPESEAIRQTRLHLEEHVAQIWAEQEEIDRRRRLEAARRLREFGSRRLRFVPRYAHGMPGRFKKKIS